MDITLVLATRKRVNLLKKLITSSTENSNNPFEIIAVYDEDDEETEIAKSDLELINPNLKLIKKKRTSRLNEDYINFAARKSLGKYIIVLNDDVEFQTPNWDTILIKHMSKFEDEITYGMTDDGSAELKKLQNLKYCCFPILTKKAINALGYAMHPCFNSWGADIHLYRIYEAVSRIVEVPIKVIHCSHYNNRRQMDETDDNSRKINNSGDPTQMDIREDVNKLFSAINFEVKLEKNKLNNGSGDPTQIDIQENVSKLFPTINFEVKLEKNKLNNNSIKTSQPCSITDKSLTRRMNVVMNKIKKS